MPLEATPLPPSEPLTRMAPGHEDLPMLPATAVRGRFADVLQRPILAWLLLAAAVFLAYLPALDAQFLWDDLLLVRDNPLIRSPLFVLEVFRHTLFGGMSNFYRPVQSLVFIADYWAFALQPFGYHLTSILIHAVNAFLLFLLLKQVLVSVLVTPDAATQRKLTPLAFLLSLIWALYPVHSATVAYVSGTADSLAMLFCILAWLCAHRSLAAASVATRMSWGIAAGICLLAGFCSKEIAFVWLVLFAVHLFLFSRISPGNVRHRCLLIGGSVLIFGIYFGLRHIPPTPETPVNTQQFSRVYMALRALGDYGSLLVYPSRLLMERQVYPPPGAALTTEDRLFYSSLTAGGLLLLSIFVLGACWRGSGQRLRLFGVVWFMCGFLPVSNLFVRINATVAEHWLYLPSVGFLLFVAGCAWQVPTQRLRAGAVGLGFVAVLGFGVRTYYRSFDWMDEITFFQQTVSAGGDVPRARLGFANAFSHQKNDDAAISLLRQVVAAQPSNLTAEVNLANALGRLGRLEEAKPILERALMHAEKAEPHSLLVLLGNLEPLEKDRPGWAMLKQAALANERKHYPDAWELVEYDALTAAKVGQAATVLDEVAHYAHTHWWHYPSWYMLGCMYADEGRSTEAVAALQQASRLDIHDAEAFFAAAQLDSGAGNAAGAVAFQRRAVTRQPDSPRQHLALSKLLSAAGQPAEAAQQMALVNTLLDRETAKGL